MIGGIRWNRFDFIVYTKINEMRAFILNKMCVYIIVVKTDQFFPQPERVFIQSKRLNDLLLSLSLSVNASVIISEDFERSDLKWECVLRLRAAISGQHGGWIRQKRGRFSHKSTHNTQRHTYIYIYIDSWWGLNVLRRSERMATRSSQWTLAAFDVSLRQTSTYWSRTRWVTVEIFDRE